MEKKNRIVSVLLVVLCVLLGGCGDFPHPLDFLPLPWGEDGEEDTSFLVEGDESLPGAEWGVFGMMHRPASGAAVEKDTDEEQVRVYVPVRTPVFSEPDAGGMSEKTVAGGSFVEVTMGSGLLWFACGDGWLYGEDLFPVENGRPKNVSLTEGILEQEFVQLEKKFPEGSYWNHMEQELPEGVETPFSVTEEPCVHGVYGQLYCNLYNGSLLGFFPQFDHLCQCLGYACLLSDRLFGEDAPLYLLPEGGQLRVGDHLRMLEYEHSVVVREVDGNGLRLAEVNAGYEDCLISWERTFTWEEWEILYAWDVEYVITRYPLYREERRWVALEPLPNYDEVD